MARARGLLEKVSAAQLPPLPPTTLGPLPALRMSKVALGLIDILLQFVPEARCARVSSIGRLLEAFKFSLRPTEARASSV